MRTQRDRPVTPALPPHPSLTFRGPAVVHQWTLASRAHLACLAKAASETTVSANATTTSETTGTTRVQSNPGHFAELWRTAGRRAVAEIRNVVQRGKGSSHGKARRGRRRLLPKCGRGEVGAEVQGGWAEARAGAPPRSPHALLQPASPARPSSNAPRQNAHAALRYTGRQLTAAMHAYAYARHAGCAG